MYRNIGRILLNNRNSSVRSYVHNNRNIISRQCHSQQSRDSAQDKLYKYLNKIVDNPLPLGVGALVVGVLQWRRIRERESRQTEKCSESGEVKLADDWQVTCYQSLPLRHVSR